MAFKKLFVAFSILYAYNSLMDGNFIGKIIHDRRIELELTLEEVGDFVGVGKSTVRKWETGAIENMKRDKIARLSEILKLSPSVVMGWSSSIVGAGQGILIPVLGRVPAGLPIEAVECILDYEEISAEMSKAGDYFGLQINGDSMSPRILDKDIVIVRKQQVADTGDVAIVLVNGDDATCKRIVHHENGLSLIAFNPTYPPKFFTAQEIETLPVQIIGKVVELRGKF